MKFFLGLTFCMGAMSVHLEAAYPFRAVGQQPIQREAVGWEKVINDARAQSAYPKLENLQHPLAEKYIACVNRAQSDELHAFCESVYRNQQLAELVNALNTPRYVHAAPVLRTTLIDSFAQRNNLYALGALTYTNLPDAEKQKIDRILKAGVQKQEGKEQLAARKDEQKKVLKPEEQPKNQGLLNLGIAGTIAAGAALLFLVVIKFHITKIGVMSDD